MSRSLRPTFLGCVLLALAACAPSPPSAASPTPIATVEPSPVATLTPTMPAATITASATPTSTAPVIVMPNCTVTIDPAFLAWYREAIYLREYYGIAAAPQVGCPIAPARSLFGAVQDFRFPLLAPSVVLRHPMLWRSDTRTIYVLRIEDPRRRLGRGWVYPDTWTEGMPEAPSACADMTPPAETYPPSPGSGMELRMPIRGFGKVWCEHGLWETVGWATGSEWGVTLTIQTAQNGVMIQANDSTILLDDLGRALVSGKPLP